MAVYDLYILIDMTVFDADDAVDQRSESNYRYIVAAYRSEYDRSIR